MPRQLSPATRTLSGSVDPRAEFRGCRPIPGGYIRKHRGEYLLANASFSDHLQTLDGGRLRMYGMGYHFKDLVTDALVDGSEPLVLAPYGFVWLAAA